MYQNQMAFAIKVNGRVLREQDKTVFLPFGSEYSLVLKNLSNRKACATITIDGEDVVHGGLIINANSTVDLERYVKEGQLDKGNRFKFIERTEKVEEGRGIRVDDGLIRIEFEFEKQPYNHFLRSPVIGSGQIFGATGAADSFIYTKTLGAYSDSLLSGPTAQVNASTAEVGVTVPGSVSDQQFYSTTFNGDGVKYVMIMSLAGERGEQKVEAPITVKSKLTCTTCKHVNPALAKFCSECGTGLEIVPVEAKIPARFKINDFVVCKGFKHIVKHVRFSADKVYYGLAFHTNPNGDVIEYESDDVYDIRQFAKMF